MIKFMNKTYEFKPTAAVLNRAENVLIRYGFEQGFSYLVPSTENEEEVVEQLQEKISTIPLHGWAEFVATALEIDVADIREGRCDTVEILLAATNILTQIYKTSYKDKIKNRY